jgi:hypothetical protein
MQQKKQESWRGAVKYTTWQLKYSGQIIKRRKRKGRRRTDVYKILVRK